MQIKTVDGSMQEISMEEAKRIYVEVRKRLTAAREDSHEEHHSHHETEAEYHDRAFHNICERAKAHHIINLKDTEDDMKKMLLYGISVGDADLVGEVVEWFISMHDKKVGA
jgi:ABC-type nickel/cobalt efflux system permease component RcnA